MMKIKFLFTLLFCSLTSLVAQVDIAEPTTQIPVEETPVGEEQNTTTDSPFNRPLELPDFKPEQSEEDKLDLPVESSTINLDYKREKGFNMTQKSTLLNPGVIFEKRWEDKKKKIALADNEGDFRRNMNLGSFNTKAGKVDVVFRDHQYPDGDRIMVLVNDDIIRPNVLLTTSYSGFNLNLEPGINKIDFVALNQGDSGPNTAHILLFYDENGTLISANEWNLATGFKATIVVVKEKE